MRPSNRISWISEDKLESLDAEMAANATNSKRLSELAAEREQTEAGSGT